MPLSKYGSASVRVTHERSGCAFFLTRNRGRERKKSKKRKKEKQVERRSRWKEPRKKSRFVPVCVIRSVSFRGSDDSITQIWNFHVFLSFLCLPFLLPSFLPRPSLPSSSFLDATTHLYKRSCPSVRPSVRASVCPVLFSNDEYGRF